MKKFSKIILSILICVVCSLGLVACGPQQTATGVETSGVASNGGVALKYGGYLYYIGGTRSNDGSFDTANTSLGSIYKAKLDDEGEVIVDAIERRCVRRQ